VEVNLGLKSYNTNLFASVPLSSYQLYTRLSLSNIKIKDVLYMKTIHNTPMASPNHPPTPTPTPTLPLTAATYTRKRRLQLQKLKVHVKIPKDLKELDEWAAKPGLTKPVQQASIGLGEITMIHDDIDVEIGEG